MITEDYVSFEVAKLLKEKGFNWECIGYYVDHEPKDVKHSLLGETNSTWESRCCSAPTIQMAMKWLREVHKIIVTIDYDEYELTSDNKKVGCGWNIQKIENPTEYLIISEHIFDNYESACEAAIKYCLENLI